jgi:hypothetical protein
LAEHTEYILENYPGYSTYRTVLLVALMTICKRGVASFHAIKYRVKKILRDLQYMGRVSQILCEALFELIISDSIIRHDIFDMIN